MWQVLNIVRKTGFTNKNFDILENIQRKYYMKFNFLFVITEYSPPFRIFSSFSVYSKDDILLGYIMFTELFYCMKD